MFIVSVFNVHTPFEFPVVRLFILVIRVQRSFFLSTEHEPGSSSFAVDADDDTIWYL